MEHHFGKGAIITPTIKKMPTVARSGVPVDFNVGLLLPELVTKNQNGSGSCGGQAISYKGESDTGVPKSARFPYCQVFVPNGGSSEQMLIKIVVTEGLADESVFTSYDNNQPPSESFMQKSDDITPAVLANAQKNQGVPEYVDLSFEGIAEAVRDHKGCIIGVGGVNNGTWLSNNPQAPTVPMGDPLMWYHWLFVCGFGMFNGKRAILVKNSWGDIGDHGKQWLTEDYLPYIFSAWTFTKGSYKFNQNMFLGMNNESVFALQARLGIKPTGNFGPKTFTAVVAYQKANKINPTGFCGPLTRAALNASR